MTQFSGAIGKLSLKTDEKKLTFKQHSRSVGTLNSNGEHFVYPFYIHQKNMEANVR